MGRKRSKCPFCGEAHSAGATRAARILLNGKSRLVTEYGVKTKCGVADIIDRTMKGKRQ